MSSSLDWIRQPEIDDATQTQLQTLFGKTGSIDVQKIQNVQQQLAIEMQRRDLPTAQAFVTNCTEASGQVFLMVSTPPVCDAETPCLQDGECVAEAQLPAGTSCHTHTDAEPAKLTLPSLQLFGQCRKEGEQLMVQQFQEGTGDESMHNDVAQQLLPPEQERVPPLNCPICAPGTHGGCLNTHTGKCSLFNEFGICPEDSAPCLPNPCRSVEQPCFDPLSPTEQPLCTPKLPDKCRLIDVSGSVCLSHACPLGSVESLETAWQLPFYRDPINYAAGLTAQSLAGHPTRDNQVRLPPGGNAVLPVEDGSPCYVGELLAAGSAWRRRSVPSWESSYVLP